jgi:hypothetical protein
MQASAKEVGSTGTKGYKSGKDKIAWKQLSKWKHSILLLA